MDHFTFEEEGGGGGGGWAIITKKKSCTEKVEKKNHAQWAEGKKNSTIVFLLVGSN